MRPQLRAADLAWAPRFPRHISTPFNVAVGFSPKAMEPIPGEESVYAAPRRPAAHHLADDRKLTATAIPRKTQPGRHDCQIVKQQPPQRHKACNCGRIQTRRRCQVSTVWAKTQFQRAEEPARHTCDQSIVWSPSTVDVDNHVDTLTAHGVRVQRNLL
jgi:hypothetical protein